MAISLDDIRQLCMEGESSRLDYKRDQYPFEGATDPEKVELFKDILTMANAFRSQTAYILIGVEQQDDGTGKVTGIAKDQFIDDAKLQQFINFKTNKQIDFISYSVPVGDNTIVQVIEIPVQRERPYYPAKRFVSIKEHAVWVRSGSSSHEAPPEEIAKMGRDDQIRQNQREIEISLVVRQNAVGDIDFHALDISSPDYDNPDPTQKNPMAIKPWGIIFYPMEKFNWIRDISKTIRVDIALKNKSNLSAEQLKVETFIPECSNKCVKEVDHFPCKPSESPARAVAVAAKVPRINPVLHPGECDDSFETLYFEVTHKGDFTLEVTVLGKDMPPIRKDFHINVEYASKTLDKNTIDALFECIQNEESYLQARSHISNGLAEGDNHA